MSANISENTIYVTFQVAALVMLQEFPVSAETQIAVLKAVIGALHHDQVQKSDFLLKL